MVQTAYLDAPPVGYAGQIATVGLKQVDSLINNSGDVLPYGIGVVRTGERTADVPSAAGQIFAGVIVRNELGAGVGVAVKEVMGVVSTGDVYVMPEQTVAYGDPVYMRVTAGDGEQVGAFRKDADGGDAVRVVGASWFRGGSTSSAAVLRLRLSQDATSEQGAEEQHIIIHPAVTADTVVYGFTTPAGRSFIVDDVVGYNATGLAASATDFFNMKLQQGATVMANWSTETGQQGTITADTPFTFIKASLANRTVPGGTRVDLVLDETGTATLPAGSVTVYGRQI